MNVLEILGVVFIASAVINFIIGFFAVKTPLSIDQIEMPEIVEQEDLTENLFLKRIY